MPKADEPPVAVTAEDNAATVKLTEWLIMHDHFFEDGPVSELREQEEFGALADELFARHRLASTPSPTDLPRVSEAMEQIFQIAQDAPELNYSNYDHDQVCDLDKAMCEIFSIAKAALSGPAGADAAHVDCRPRNLEDGTPCEFVSCAYPAPADRFAEGLEAAAKVAEDQYADEAWAGHYRIAGKSIAAAIRNLNPRQEGEG